LAQFSLEKAARAFTNELTDLLNGTVCDGIRLSAVYSKVRKKAWVGYKITKNAAASEEAVPIGCTGGQPHVYLGISQTLAVDETGGPYLMVVSSYMGLFLTPRMDYPLLHYDFERGKPDDYPEAHLQVVASSPGWEHLISECEESGDAQRELCDLHLPVGGRRFRPTLEDLIEFLVVERFVEARPGWRAELAKTRESFRIKQLRAAVRRDPATARQELEELDASN
jgi:hypothetical protein